MTQKIDKNNDIVKVLGSLNDWIISDVTTSEQNKKNNKRFKEKQKKKNEELELKLQ